MILNDELYQFVQGMRFGDAKGEDSELIMPDIHRVSRLADAS